MACTVDGQLYFEGFGGYGRNGWIGPNIPNAVNDLVFSTSASIVTVDEVKSDLKIDFNDEDAYITDLIPLCQGHIEQFCGISCNTRTMQAVLCNFEGGIEIPYGPIQSITSAFDENGNDITTSIITNGISFKWIKSPNYRYINLTYVAGYTSDDLPLDIKKALRMEVGFRYRFRNQEEPIRGVVNPGLCDDATIYLKPYQRRRFM